MTSKTKIEQLKQNDLLSFLGMIALAFIISLIPVLHWPFSWVQTFFHEASHGIIAILTEGSVHRIELNLDGSGTCTTSGGIRFFISFAGYAGAIMWGALIYIMSDSSSEKRADQISMLILGFIGLTCLFFARDIITFIILGIIAAPFIVILKTKEIEIENKFMRLLGLYILLDALKTPTYIFDGTRESDAATLQHLTWIPQFVWILIWLALGGFTLLHIFRRHIKFEQSRRDETLKL